MDHSSPALCSVRAVTFCHLYVVSTNTLKKLLKVFPEATDAFSTNQAIASRAGSMLVGAMYTESDTEEPSMLRRFVSKIVPSDSIASRGSQGSGGMLGRRSNRLRGAFTSAKMGASTNAGFSKRTGGGASGLGFGASGLHQKRGGRGSRGGPALPPVREPTARRGRRMSITSSRRPTGKGSLRWWTDGDTNMPMSLRSLMEDEDGEVQLPFVVHPRSVLHTLRLALSCISVVYFSFTVPTRIVFSPSVPPWYLLLLDFTFDLIMWAAMALQLRTAYVARGALVISPTEIALRYLTSSFPLDLVSSFPTDILWVRNGHVAWWWRQVLVRFHRAVHSPLSL
mgnify:CR=1 FL=1